MEACTTAQSQALKVAGEEILHHCIRAGYEAHQRLAILVVTDIKNDAALVRVEV